MSGNYVDRTKYIQWTVAV